MDIIIMRHPVLMEDEGRHFYIMTCKSEEEAREWIASQKGEYFSPSDYYMTSIGADNA